MKNKKMKKLQLKTETLRSLNEKKLGAAQGAWGGFYISTQCFSTESDTKCPNGYCGGGGTASDICTWCC